MAAVIETIITCDGPRDVGCEGTYAGGDARHYTAAQQRKRYVNEGWRFYKGKDYCPHCAKSLAPARYPVGAVRVGGGVVGVLVWLQRRE